MEHRRCNLSKSLRLRLNSPTEETYLPMALMSWRKARMSQSKVTKPSNSSGKVNSWRSLTKATKRFFTTILTKKSTKKKRKRYKKSKKRMCKNSRHQSRAKKMVANTLKPSKWSTTRTSRSTRYKSNCPTRSRTKTSKASLEVCWSTTSLRRS